MSEAPPDFKALARRYLDLWQSQAAAMAADPALAEAMARGIAMMTQMPALLAQAAAAAVPTPDEGRTADEARPETAAAAPSVARGDADGIAGRVAALEERVAALEAALGGRGGKPEGKPRRRRA